MALAGARMSIGSSATNTRPSGATQTTEGCRMSGAAATSSTFQSGRQAGDAASAPAADASHANSNPRQRIIVGVHARTGAPMKDEKPRLGITTYAVDATWQNRSAAVCG